MTKLLYIPNGEYITATFYTADKLLDTIIRMAEAHNEYSIRWLRQNHLPENYWFSREEFEIIYD